MATSNPLAARLLQQLQATDLGPLRPAEQLVLTNNVLQNTADCSQVFTNGTINNVVRGAFLRNLCLALLADGPEQMPVLDIANAHFQITPVDLSGLILPSMTMYLNNCIFDQDIGLVDLTESHFLSVEMNGSTAPAVAFSNSVLDANLSLDSFTCTGDVSLDGVKISGALLATKATIGTRESGATFLLQDANIQDSLYLTELVVWGVVNLTGAKIGGDVVCSGTKLHRSKDRTMSFEKAEIAGEVSFSDGFWSDGLVWIDNCTIKNGVMVPGKVGAPNTFLDSSTGDGTRKLALRLTDSKIDGTTSFEHGFHCEGLSCENSSFGMLSVCGTINGSGLNLTNAKAIIYTDEKSTRKTDPLQLEGFAYKGIRDDKYKNDSRQRDRIDLDDRLDWLALGSGTSPQPYLQLAAILREQGDDSAATRVLVELKRKMTKAGSFSDSAGDISLSPIGYGFHPGYAAGYMVILTGLSAVVYRRQYMMRHMTPTEERAYEYFKKENRPPAYYTRFSALMYSLESTFPLVNLGQAAKWQPDPCSKMRPFRLEGLVASKARERRRSSKERQNLLRCARLLRELSRARWLQTFLWIHILFGWLLATLLVAGIAGVIQK